MLVDDDDLIEMGFKFNENKNKCQEKFYLKKNMNYLIKFLKPNFTNVFHKTKDIGQPLATATTSTTTTTTTTTIPPPRKMTNLVWIDMEMTGLNIEKDRIMELACIITDNQLNVIAEGPNLVVHQPDELLNSMDDWCTKTHKQTGLFEQCRQSQTTEEQAEYEMLQFVQKYTQKKQSPIAGNSVWVDRLFLRKYMPTLEDYMHYRIIDVSTIKELCKRWNSGVFSRVPKKQLIHRGLDDIKESISELKYYKPFMFN